MADISSVRDIFCIGDWSSVGYFAFVNNAVPDQDFASNPKLHYPFKIAVPLYFGHCISPYTMSVQI